MWCPSSEALVNTHSWAQPGSTHTSPDQLPITAAASPETSGSAHTPRLKSPLLSGSLQQQLRVSSTLFYLLQPTPPSLPLHSPNPSQHTQHRFPSPNPAPPVVFPVISMTPTTSHPLLSLGILSPILSCRRCATASPRASQQPGDMSGTCAAAMDQDPSGGSSLSLHPPLECALPALGVFNAARDGVYLE